MQNIIWLDDEVIIKRYKIRMTGSQGRSIETTVPREVLAREARRLGLTVEEAVEKLEEVWRYNSFARERAGSGMMLG